jgi:hypothetical protein
MASRRLPSRNSDLAGAPPKLATLDDLAIPTAAKTGRAYPASKSAITSRAPHRINLKAVIEACIDEGLDPAVEIAKALNRASKFLRGECGRALESKFTPDLRFLADTSYDAALKMNDLFNDPKVRADLIKPADEA